mmetsp:Transcript_8841/g.10359  ORF Transcript_8841/g.10359 Transcript_8841/m.10359 type:complete len:388 (-) Transcript_8841:82-1245(-)
MLSKIMPAETLEKVDLFSALTNHKSNGILLNTEDRPGDKNNSKNDDNGCTTSKNTVNIEERLNKAVELVAISTESVQKNRSPDLIPLTAEFVQMKKRLRALIVVINKYQKRFRDFNKSKFEIAEQLALLSEPTPIREEISCELDGEATEQLQQLLERQHSSSPTSSLPLSPSSMVSNSSFQCAWSSPSTASSASFVASAEITGKLNTIPHTVSQVAKDYRERSGADILSLYGLYSLAAAHAVVNDQDFQKYVVDFVTEWEKIVAEQVGSGLKQVKKLASDRLHYERKIEKLRNRANELEIKGRTSPNAVVERLSRNENKLKQAFAVHEKEASRLCALLEAITHDGYKDLYTLVNNYIKWEINRVEQESDIAVQMSATLDSMSYKCEK